MEQITIETRGDQTGFKITLLESDEWDQLPQIFVQDAEIFQRHWMTQVRPLKSGSQEPDREGYLLIKPVVIRLRPGLHYCIYRDQNRQGHPCPVQFFLSEDHFVLLENQSVAVDKVKEWAERGVISNTMDLARVLGARVLRHHQARLELIEDHMQELEGEILERPVAKQQTRIISLHRQVIGLKKSLNRHLAAFTRLALIDKELEADWKELTLETQREIENVRQTHDLVESLREAYQAAMDNRDNEIMKFLTILATVVLPINMLASFFGMNFEHMPFIQLPHGIYVFTGLSAVVVVIVLLFFHKKDWLR